MVRIVAGTAGGRRLATPPGRATRPTSELVREGVFATVGSLLGPLEGLVVLDLYAGSGALACEALSRGAARAVLVESDRRAARVAAANVAGLDRGRARVLTMRAEQFAARPRPADEPPFDLVLADPPYAVRDAALRAVLDQLDAQGWLAPGALVVLERATGPEWVWPEAVTPVRARRYGSTTVWYGRARPGPRCGPHDRDPGRIP